VVGKSEREESDIFFKYDRVRNNTARMKPLSPNENGLIPKKVRKERRNASQEKKIPIMPGTLN
jgi:hypothetical protein